MKSKYLDIFIDFDDTLYDTHGNAVISLQELFEQYNFSEYFDNLDDFTVPFWEANEQLWAQYALGEITRDFLIIERFRRPLSFGRGLDPSEAFCLEVSDCYLEICSNKSGVVEGCYELLDYLKQNGYKLHLCSNGFHEVQYKKLASSHWTEYFDTIVLSEDAGANKPSNEYFEYAFRVTNAQPASTIMIGDNLKTDILGAKNAGIDQIYFNRRGGQVSNRSEVTYEVTSLKEILTIL